MDKLTKEAIRKQIMKSLEPTTFTVWENDCDIKSIADEIMKLISKAYKVGLEEGKAYHGRNKREWYMKGVAAGRKEIVAYCKICKRPRSISPKGFCPGCLRRGSIVFDTEINILKEGLKDGGKMNKQNKKVREEFEKEFANLYSINGGKKLYAQNDVWQFIEKALASQKAEILIKIMEPLSKHISRFGKADCLKKQYRD